jgi:nicotinate phosphoribosyltransferase
MSTESLNIEPPDYSLLTDLYQLTMAACYTGEGIEEKKACFELFVRKLPSNFTYLIAMGLEQVLDYLQNISFSAKQIENLQATGIFKNVPSKFWSLLESGHFTGDLWAIPEGTAIFPNEPFLRIEAPLWQAQLVETYILNTINYQTLIATKAARIRDLTGDEAIILEFGTRRAFSPQGAMWAARAAIAGGFNATSNVLAALKLGQKPAGTMAHALVMAIKAIEGTEDDAFEAFQRYFPSATLLIDTYDTVAAAERLAQKVNQGKMQLTGVRLDSGDLVELSQKVRSLLPEITIFASGDLNEFEIKRLKQEGATIDGYGIGTKLVTGQPVNGVYKLVEIDGIPTLKLSQDKKTYPGRKQIFRAKNQDRLGLMSENAEKEETPLLKLVMKEGKRLEERESLTTIQKRTRNSVFNLPDPIRNIDSAHNYLVKISAKLESLRKSLSVQ